MRVFAILQEPASYTVDRNKAVYDRMGVNYAYLSGGSVAGTVDDARGIGLVPVGFWTRIKYLKNVLRGNDIVIMNGYNGPVFLILFMLNVFYGRCIGIDSDTQLVIPEGRIKRLIKTVYLNIVFRNRHICGLAGGTKTHKELFRHFGMSEDRIFLMPMMVDNSKFSVQRKDDASFTFLYVGRIVECKNIEVLLEAFIAGFRNRNEIKLKIVGDGDMLPYFREKYASYSNIEFAGKCFSGSLLEKYSQASVFVLPSAFEPWGLVVNEALSAGLPVIVSDQVGARFDLVEGRDTGFVFKWNDVDDLKKKMALMECDRALHARFSRNAVSLMTDHWNYGLYEDCLNRFIAYVKDKKHN